MKETFLLVDEYDWILFDGPNNQAKQILMSLKNFKKVMAFTGTKLIPNELNLLKLLFD